MSGKEDPHADVNPSLLPPSPSRNLAFPSRSLFSCCPVPAKSFKQRLPVDGSCKDGGCSLGNEVILMPRGLCPGNWFSLVSSLEEPLLSVPFLFFECFLFPSLLLFCDLPGLLQHLFVPAFVSWYLPFPASALSCPRFHVRLKYSRPTALSEQTCRVYYGLDFVWESRMGGKTYVCFCTNEMLISEPKFSSLIYGDLPKNRKC